MDSAWITALAAVGTFLAEAAPIAAAGVGIGAGIRHIVGFAEGHPWWEDPVGDLTASARDFGTGLATAGIGSALSSTIGNATNSAIGSVAQQVGGAAPGSAGQVVPKIAEDIAAHGADVASAGSTAADAGTASVTGHGLSSIGGQSLGGTGVQSVGSQVASQMGAPISPFASAAGGIAKGAGAGALSTLIRGDTNPNDILRGAATGGVSGGVTAGLSQALTPKAPTTILGAGGGIGDYANDANYAAYNDTPFVGPTQPPNPLSQAISRAYQPIQNVAGNIAQMPGNIAQRVSNLAGNVSSLAQDPSQIPSALLARAQGALPRIAGGLAGQAVGMAMPPTPPSVPGVAVPQSVLPYPTARQNPWIRQYYV